MMEEPMPQTMKLARHMVNELERLNAIRFGDASWAIIGKWLARMDTRWHEAWDKDSQQSYKRIMELEDENKALKEQLELQGGYSAFLRVCASSGEKPETFEWYVQKTMEDRKVDR